jgi:hypothetical protein
MGEGNELGEGISPDADQNRCDKLGSLDIGLVMKWIPILARMSQQVFHLLKRHRVFIFYVSGFAFLGFCHKYGRTFPLSIFLLSTTGPRPGQGYHLV